MEVSSQLRWKTNCLTEIMFSSALERASELDLYYAEHGKPIGPLHGVVMTLKDQFDCQGFDTTLGYVGRAQRPADHDALLVRILRSLGAVFIAKTNLPQSIMWCETNGPLWGLTTNPLNAELTPGGSSGGEGAVLAERGSLVGWGTDIGGSVRIPAHMQGLYSLKPSVSRLLRGVKIISDDDPEREISLRWLSSLNSRTGACALCGWSHGKIVDIYRDCNETCHRCSTLGAGSDLSSFALARRNLP